MNDDALTPETGVELTELLQDLNQLREISQAAAPGPYEYRNVITCNPKCETPQNDVGDITNAECEGVARALYRKEAEFFIAARKFLTLKNIDLLRDIAKTALSK